MRTLHDRLTVAAVLLLLPFGLLHAADALTSKQKEDFLSNAKLGKIKDSPDGITGTSQVTLSDGTITHDSSVQTIDEYRANYLNELGFKDTYKDNIAAWKLAKLLGIDDMLPPTVKRSFNGKPASFSWWIDDLMMKETDRRAKKLQAPNAELWKQENAVMEVFDQLIYNIDRNQGNMLIDKDWHLWLIDESRSFRSVKALRDKSVLKTCDRTMLAKMKALDEATLTKEFGKDVSKDEINALLARRDLIVKFFEAKGESALFDRPARN
jgi:hypothetical protein